MFKRLLIVLDSHPDPGAVIQSGLAMASACDAEVVFCSGLLRDRAVAAELPNGETAAKWKLLDQRREQEQRLQAKAHGLAEQFGVMSRSVSASGDDPVLAIIDAAESCRCDLIVAASEGSNAVVRLLTGSFIPGLVTASPLPVMVCSPKPPLPGRSPSGAAQRRVLVVLEDHDSAQAALTKGLALAHGLGAVLLFVHSSAADVLPVVEMPGFAAGSHDALAAEIQLRSQRLLAAACASAQTAGLRAEGLSLPAGTLARDIAHLAVDRSCSWIVIAHSGSNAVMRLLNGCPIPGLITAAEVPIVIFRDVEEEPRRKGTRRRLHRHKAATAAGATVDAHDH